MRTATSEVIVKSARQDQAANDKTMTDHDEILSSVNNQQLFKDFKDAQSPRSKLFETGLSEEVLEDIAGGTRLGVG